MLKKITAYGLACYFLLGSMLLPLSDFSLMRDLPQMYHSYQKLAKEQDVIDFIGDYLLNGKTLFGHNRHDTPESSQTSVQFQHAANFCSIVAPQVQLTRVIVIEQPVKHAQADLPVNTSDFHPELLRPPLAA